VIPQTLNFAISTTTASPNLATFARLAEGIGQEEVLSEMSQSEEAAGGIKEAKEVVQSPRQTAPISNRVVLVPLAQFLLIVEQPLII
jgi:hypothetical protein